MKVLTMRLGRTGLDAFPQLPATERVRSAGGLQAALGKLARWIWPAIAQPRAARQLRVVETLHLGAKAKVVLISCRGERFLVGTGSDSVETIVRLRDEADPAGDAQ